MFMDIMIGCSALVGVDSHSLDFQTLITLWYRISNKNRIDGRDNRYRAGPLRP
jgi:hypothetical protein